MKHYINTKKARDILTTENFALLERMSLKYSTQRCENVIGVDTMELHSNEDE